MVDRIVRILSWLAAVIVCVACVSCKGGDLQGQVSRAELTAQIDQAEHKWQERGIDSYRIIVRDSSLWHFQIHDIVVRNGSVAEASASCIPAPIEGRECKVREFDAADYIVPGLLSRARWIVERGKPQFIRLEFDAKYGYPTRIAYDDPEITDEEWGWGVQEFEVLD